MIPFNRSTIQGREFEYIAEAMRNGQIAGDQQFSRKCQALLEERLGVKKVLVTTSCTHALEMAALLLDIKEGDEVIVPDFTFVSTANAFVMRGARPVFCDIRRDTMNLDEQQLESLITPRTRAIIPVHYAGVACEMDVIMDIADRYGIPVVEDNAHGLLGKYKDKYLGTFGALATQSFHETKNITCGEGGALIINDERYIERAEILREKGTDRSKFFRGEVDKYGWVDIGSNYVMSDVLAAFLFGQLEQMDAVQTRRRDIWVRYNDELREWAEMNAVELPVIQWYCEPAWHMYQLVMPSPEARSHFIRHMKQAGVICVFHYQPLHLSRHAERWKGLRGDFPVTEYVSDRLVRLPFYNDLGIEDQQYIMDHVLSCRVGRT